MLPQHSCTKSCNLHSHSASAVGLQHQQHTNEQQVSQTKPQHETCILLISMLLLLRAAQSAYEGQPKLLRANLLGARDRAQSSHLKEHTLRPALQRRVENILACTIVQHAE